MQPSPTTSHHCKFRCDPPRPGRCIDRCPKSTLFEVNFTLDTALILTNRLALQVNYLLPEPSQSSGVFR